MSQISSLSTMEVAVSCRSGRSSQVTSLAYAAEIRTPATGCGAICITPRRDSTASQEKDSTGTPFWAKAVARNLSVEGFPGRWDESHVRVTCCTARSSSPSDSICERAPCNAA